VTPTNIGALLELYSRTAEWQARRNELDGELWRMARETPHALLPYLDDARVTAVTTRRANFRITQFPNVRVWELIDSALAKVHGVPDHHVASESIRFWSRFDFPMTNAAPRPTDLESLIADVRGEDMGRFEAAVEVLERVTDRTWLPRLYELLDDEDIVVRGAVRWPVAIMDGLRAMPAILTALERDLADGADGDGYLETMEFILEANPADGASLLQSWILDPAAKKRQHAAWLWPVLGERLPIDPLLAAAADRDAGVREDVVGSLESYPEEPRAREAVFARLEDPEPKIGDLAACILAYMGDPRAEAALRARLLRCLPSSKSLLEDALRGLHSRGGRGR
jgi:hypothetical protein